MCNLYSITTNQAAIINLFRVINRYVGNLEAFSMVSAARAPPSRGPCRNLLRRLSCMSRRTHFCAYAGGRLGPRRRALRLEIDTREVTQERADHQARTRAVSLGGVRACEWLAVSIKGRPPMDFGVAPRG